MTEELLTAEEIINQIKERTKTEFVPLFHEDGGPAGAGYSKKTKLIYKDLDQMVNDFYRPHATKEEQKALDDIRHREQSEKAAKIEAERFNKAEKIKFAEWSGEQFFDGGYNFHIEIEDFLESCFEFSGNNFDEYPKYLWATKPLPYITNKDAWEVYESDIEDLESGEYDWPVYGVEALQVALDAFVDANKNNVAHWPDYTKALLIEDEIQKFKETIDA